MVLAVKARRSRVVLWSLLAALTALLIIYHIAMVTYAADDAYIHFRVARNLIDHGVPYFNVDEQVKASSSSAWTLFLAGLFHLFGANLTVLAVCNALFTAAGAVVWTDVIRGAGQARRWYIAVSFLLVLSVLIRPSTLLMET